MDLNTCYETTSFYHTIAYYSHFIPVAIALFLGIYAAYKTKFSKLAVIFCLFSVSFSIWLLNDVILWTSQDYFKIVFFWSWIDYINVVFFVLAVFFFGVLARGKITIAEKIILGILCVPAFIFTVTGNAITSFDHTWCEAINNDQSVLYKVFVEYISIGMMLLSLIVAWKNSDKGKKVLLSIIFLTLVLFLITFSITEYIAAQTAIYEINLYGLFVLPVFLIAMVFAITNLHIFNIRYLGTQILVYVLLIMVGSQFLFLESSTDAALNIITLGTAIVLGLVLLQNAKRELDARIKIEKLAEELQTANKGQANLLHFINHQIKGYLSKSRIIFSELRDDPDYGPISEKAKPLLDEGFNSLTEGAAFVQQILKGSNIEKGVLTYDMKPTDFRNLVSSVAEDMKEQAEKKGLEYKTEFADGEYQINGDEKELKEAVKNFIDNSIKYTPSGSISLKLSRQDGKVLFSVKDTGIGMSDETKEKLFTKGGRGKDSQKINIYSTGFGLSIVKGIVEAHKGRVWAESEGEGKGSQFYMELPVV